MNVLEPFRRMRPATLLLALSSMFIAAGGFIHLREWIDVYRHVPAAAPGAFVVRIGFPLNTAASVALVAALVLVVRRRARFTQPVILGAVAFQMASLATLIATRVASVFGWSEPAWTSGAQQTRAVEAAAIVALLVLAAVVRSDRTRTQVHGLNQADARPEDALCRQSPPRTRFRRRGKSGRNDQRSGARRS